MYYAIYISHKKDPNAKSFITYEVNVDKETTKELLAKTLKVNIDKIEEISKEIYEKCYVSVFQGLHCLDLYYTEERKKKRAEFFKKLYRKLFHRRSKT